MADSPRINTPAAQKGTSSTIHLLTIMLVVSCVYGLGYVGARKLQLVVFAPDYAGWIRTPQPWLASYSVIPNDHGRRGGFGGVKDALKRPVFYVLYPAAFVETYLRSMLIPQYDREQERAASIQKLNEVR